MTVTVELRRVVALTSGAPAATSRVLLRVASAERLGGTADRSAVQRLRSRRGLPPGVARRAVHGAHHRRPGGIRKAARPDRRTVRRDDEPQPVTMTSGPTGSLASRCSSKPDRRRRSRGRPASTSPARTSSAACNALTPTVSCSSTSFPFGTYTTHIAPVGQASQPYLIPQGYVVPDSIQVGASDVRQAPQAVVVHKRRLEVHAGSPTTGPQPGLVLPLADPLVAARRPARRLVLRRRRRCFRRHRDLRCILRATGLQRHHVRAPGRQQPGRSRRASEEKVLGPFDQTTNPQVVNVTTADNHAPVAGDDNADAISGTDTVIGVLAERHGPGRGSAHAGLGQRAAARDGDDPARQARDRRDRDLRLRDPPALHE